MNVAIEKLPECRAKLSAEVPADTVTETRNGVVKAFMSQAKVPGFRPGKLPRKVVENKYSTEIEEELKERLTRTVLREAIENQKLELLGVAAVEREVFENDGTFSYISEVVTKPEVELSEEEYKNIEVEVVKQEVTDDMIDDWLARVQANFAEYKEADGEIEHGDRAMIVYTATKDGEPLAEQLKEEMAPIAHRDEAFELMIPKEGENGYEMIPGLADAIVGLKAGDSKEVDVTFGDDYFIEELKGISAVYKVDVESVQKPDLPPIDDDLARKVGGENLEAIKEHFTNEMKAQFEQGRIQQIDNQILERLNKEHEFEIPREQVFDETQHFVNQMVTNAYQQGMNPDDVDKHENEIVEDATARAVSNIRTRYMLDVIAEKEKITVSDDELTRQVVYMANQAKKPIKKYARELRDGPGFDGVRRDIMISKTIAFLRENANVTEVDAKPEEEEKDS
ncbi:MAG: trigger factor [Verrucomicrobiales bacterium]|nr:trigger factor [Verrucomicrobiales bacterium]